MRTLKSVALLSYLVLATSLSFGQEILYIQWQRFEIGMSKVEVLNLLNKMKNCNIKEQPDENSILLMNEAPENGIIGQFFFTNGDILRQASKNWGKFSNMEGLRFVSKLYSIIYSYNDAGKETASISINKLTEPGFTLQILKIDFGQKEIEVTKSEGGGSRPFVQIVEHLKE